MRERTAVAITIKGINTGIIRQKNEFIVLALKIKEPRNKESLFFLSPFGLRDLLIALESRLHTKHLLGEDARLPQIIKTVRNGGYVLAGQVNVEPHA